MMLPGLPLAAASAYFATMAFLSTSKPAAWVRPWFRGAALYGTAALLATAVRPPSAGAALFFYGFLGTAFAFQIAFWMIGGDPVRYRPLMLAAAVEKAAFVGPAAALAMAGRIDGVTLAAGLVDLFLGVGFLVAWRVTPRPA